MNDRRGRKTKVFGKLGISVENIRRNIAESCNAIEPNIEPFDDNDSHDKSAIVETLGNDMFIYPTWSNDNNRFDLCILNKLWQEMKPVTRVYNGRQYLTLPPGVWSDIMAENFWKQYRMSYGFTFKKATVSLNPSRPFLYIIGKCKSSDCDNKFQAIAEKEPICGIDLLLSVYFYLKTQETFLFTKIFRDNCEMKNVRLLEHNY